MHIAKTMTQVAARAHVATAAKALAGEGDTATALTNLERVITKHSGPIAGSAQGFRQSVQSWSLLGSDQRATVLGRMHAVETGFKANFTHPTSAGASTEINAAHLGRAGRSPEEVAKLVAYHRTPAGS